MVRSRRGVVLVQVLILVMLMAWIASMLLTATVSRKINARKAMDSNEVRETMNAVSSSISACLAHHVNASNVVVGWPAPGTCKNPPSCADANPCASPPADPCMPPNPGKLDQRGFAYCIGNGPNGGMPCRVRVNVCSNDGTCPKPSCP